ncbi:hypothetical protein TYRP_013705 [Tyrophagus putrescentiae]|nr:hypothetical protein TYRP_013705 [Tyrophagus putrescentiae]
MALSLSPDLSSPLAGSLARSSLPWPWAHRWSTSSPPLPSLEHLFITTINFISLAFGIIVGAPLHHPTTIDSTSSSLDSITIAGPSSRDTSSPSPPSTRLGRVWTSSPSSREHLITLITIDSTCSSWDFITIIAGAPHHPRLDLLEFVIAGPLHRWTFPFR